MEAAARALLIVVAAALLVNLAQGGPGRVKRWTVRTLTGRDLVGPEQTTTTSRPRTAIGQASQTTTSGRV